MLYEGVFGGLGVRPSLIWTHDFKGLGAGPAIAFIEKRKSITAALALNLSNRWTARLSYTSFFDGEPLNLLADRDFMSFNLTFYH